MARGLLFVLTCRFDQIPNNLGGKGEATVSLCGRPSIPHWLLAPFDLGLDPFVWLEQPPQLRPECFFGPDDLVLLLALNSNYL
jgi:hypothetical protein